VVFISQPQIGDQLSQFAVEFGEVSDLPVVYKLHPHEYDDWEDKYPHLEQSRVQVVCDEPQLYEILAESTVQVGVDSTVLYEGLNFDLDTYIFENVEIYLSQLIQTEYAEGVSTVEDLSREIHSNNADKHNVNQFFRKNAIQNMEDALSDVVNREKNVSLE
jgi:hypothetical protein